MFSFFFFLPSFLVVFFARLEPRRRLDDSSLVFFQQAFRLPTRQPLVDHFHWYSDLLLHAVRKPFRFFGHFATRAVQPQRQPPHNLLPALLTDHLTQTPHILP